MCKVLCVGHSVLDLIFNVNNLPSEDGKYMATAFTSVGGGPAANAAVTVAQLGGESYFAGRIGDDHHGKNILQDLQSYAVNCDYVNVVEEVPSSLSAVIVDAFGNRQIINYKDPKLDDSLAQLMRVDWSAFDVVLADVRWGKGAKYAMEQAKQYGVPSVLDADVSDDDIAELVSLADFVIFSQPGLSKLAQTNDAKQALCVLRDRYTGSLSVTLGGDGVLYFDDKGDLQHFAGLRVDVVDTTAAGDVYHGAFAYYLAKHGSDDTHSAIRFSSATAALKCTRMGGRKGIPTLSDVLAFMEKRV